MHYFQQMQQLNFVLNCSPPYLSGVPYENYITYNTHSYVCVCVCVCVCVYVHNTCMYSASTHYTTAILTKRRQRAEGESD